MKTKLSRTDRLLICTLAMLLYAATGGDLIIRIAAFVALVAVSYVWVDRTKEE